MVVTKRAIDLTQSEVDRCRELTYGDEGWMLEDFDRALAEETGARRYRYTQVVLYTNRYGTIQGWCLLQPIKRSSRYMAYFYVDHKHRGKGIGTKLIKEANKWGRYRPGVMVDLTNRGFFESVPDLHERI